MQNRTTLSLSKKPFRYLSQIRFCLVAHSSRISCIPLGSEPKPCCRRVTIYLLLNLSASIRKACSALWLDWRLYSLRFGAGRLCLPRSNIGLSPLYVSFFHALTREFIGLAGLVPENRLIYILSSSTQITQEGESRL